MADFRRSPRLPRTPATPMRRVVHPAAWTSESLGGVDDFSCRIGERDADEMIAGIAAFRRHGVPSEEGARSNFPLHGLADVLADVRRELVDGRGIVMLRGFPVERLSREEQAIAYLGLG